MTHQSLPPRLRGVAARAKNKSSAPSPNDQITAPPSATDDLRTQCRMLPQHTAGRQVMTTAFATPELDILLRMTYLAGKLRTVVVDEHVLFLQQVGRLMEILPCLTDQEVCHSCRHLNLHAQERQ